MNIIADPNIPFVREAFGACGQITLVPGRQITATTVRDADALLVRSVTPVNESLLAGSQVKFVATATIGTDHIDERYLSLTGIGFASAAGSNANSVAEYVVAALLEIAHHGKYRMRDRTLGVVGVGNVGSKVVQYAEALGMRVLPNDPPRQRAETLPNFVALERVLAEADIVTLHVPLTREGPDATFHLLDHHNLERVLLLNSSRGGVVDNRALLKAIDGNRLAGTVLDVWENEPHISPELLDVVDLGTPHIAGYSFDGKVNGTRLIYEAFCRHFGLPAQWQPILPAPPVPLLRVRVEPGEDDEAVLHRVIRGVYDITRDDTDLRRNVRNFDQLRADYPVRREFFNTEVVLNDSGGSLRQKLAALGFRT